MQKILSITLLTLILILGNSRVFAARNSSIDEAKVAIFVGNLHNNIYSPTGKLCIYGYDSVVAVIYDNLGGDKLLNINDSNERSVAFCNLVYIAINKEKYVTNFISDFENRGVATISYIEDFTEKNGSFGIQDGRRGSLKLTINRDSVKKLNIKLNPIVFSAAESQ